MVPAGIFASGVQEQALEVVPEGLRAKVGEVLSTAGSNGDSLAQVVLELDGEEEIAAAAFLLANLSRVDRVSLSPSTLKQHVQFAVQARREFPWGREISDELFLGYVVPHRVAQEPLQDWREPFYEGLKDRVASCSTATEAALEINRWCHESVTYQPTDWRDMGPLTTWKAGLGRCEEEMIFSICAARSVGIPARSCYTPAWGFQDDNHAWVEVWTDGDWRYLGACEPASELNKAWFSNATKRAALVLSVGYGSFPEGEGSGEPVYRKGDNYTIVNSTGVYTDTVALRFELRFPDGTPADSMNIWAGVFTYGAIRPLARIPTDSMGIGKCVFGATDLTVSAGNDSLGVFRVLRIRPEMDRTIQLVLGDDYVPDTEIMLHHPTKDVPEQEGESMTEQDSLQQVIAKLEGKLRDAGRREYELEQRAMNPELAALSDRFDDRWSRVTEVLNDARGNWQELAGVVEKCDSVYLDDLLWVLDDMSQKDRWEITGEVLGEHFHYGELVRDYYQETVPDSVYRQHVLPVIIDREPPLAWRKALYEELRHLREASIESTAEAVNQWLADRVEEIEERTPFRHRATPIEVLWKGGGDKRDLAVMAVGCLRAVGIPARVAQGDRWAEWFDGQDFMPLYPLEPDRLGDTEKDSDSEQVYREEGTVALTFLQADTVTTKPEFEKDFTLSRWEDGFFWADFREGEYQDSSYYLTVESGDWLLTFGRRKKPEETFVRTMMVSVAPSDTLDITLVTDMPEE